MTRASVDPNTAALAIPDRVGLLEWPRLTADLDTYGCATISSLLTPAECGELAGLYTDDQRFRSRIVMARHGFGRGEYKYFASPLPEIVADLRRTLYPP
ncbi:MAG: 2OG-Fe(II) oxygenase, partial [Vicinamibacteraceae bacterium]